MKKILSMMMVLLVPLWVISGCGYSGGAGDGGNGDGNGQDGNGGDSKCTPHDSTMCAEGVTYWVDSCGSIEEVKEMCGCGCNSTDTDCDDCTDLPCSSNADCPTGWSCDLGTNKCKQQGCTSDLDCPTGFKCNSSGVCERDSCVPECAGKCCGSNGCDGTCPNACVPGEVCDLGTCQCKPDVTCTSNEDCPQGYQCNTVTGECEEIVCTPKCEGKCCGSDSCGSTCPNTCPTGFTCNMGSCLCELDSTCTSDSQCPTMHCCRDGNCVPAACGNMQCGHDYVCELSCGTCPAGSTCDYQTYQCVPDTPGDLCPTGQACTVMSDNGIMGCLIPPDTIPPGNQTDCGAEGCTGNFMCYCNDADCVSTICIQNCGTCPTGTECCLLTESGIYGCLPTGCGGLPANPPSCDDNIPCQGNAGCFYTGSTYICIDLCSSSSP
jgi:Cys-rich repeat protein